MSHSCCDPKPTPETVKAGAKDPANCTDSQVAGNAVSHSNEHSGCHSACCMIIMSPIRPTPLPKSTLPGLLKVSSISGKYWVWTVPAVPVKSKLRFPG